MCTKNKGKTGTCLWNPVLALWRNQQRESATDASLRMVNPKETYRSSWVMMSELCIRDRLENDLRICFALLLKFLHGF
jgi:hypothetical protein